ncbi:hypothetical protein J5N97_000698 [Dioscorea zingiberensis]|uniref:Uncharacterized protein n=1 Tax=Dioscorea zingiberensis TaxID=325984 RepID=A0A9D5H368_9LILI|nr:hypothetical protein J5N97_000698 [Dioscorea zingiberensis]
MKSKLKQEQVADTRSLVGLVFSWSIRDVLNENLYRNQVQRIPETFGSLTSYKKSFIPPLVEETHADLLSNMLNLSHAPTCEILTIEDSAGPPGDLFYDVTYQRDTETDENHKGLMYEPQFDSMPSPEFRKINMGSSWYWQDEDNESDTLALFQLKCRTLTCTPTNIAVLEVAARLRRLVNQSLEYGRYGLGDIVLFGNKKRMKIDNNDDLRDIFLDHRVKILIKCLVPLSGWKHLLESMIHLLDDPEEQYSLYLEKRAEKQKQNAQKMRRIIENIMEMRIIL